MRNDFQGLGHYGAKRGSRIHRGLDLLCLPDLPIYADTDLEFVRIAKPYIGFDGGLWRNGNKEVKIFYCVPIRDKKRFKKGDVIAYCQNVASGLLMMPHIHVEIFKDGERINPLDEIEIIKKGS